MFGDFTEGFVTAGGIFNPFGRNHGAPDDEERMVGDLGDIICVVTGNVIGNICDFLNQEISRRMSLEWQS